MDKEGVLPMQHPLSSKGVFNMDRVWLITGAGRGFGKAFAEEAVKQGDRVIAGMRKILEDPFWKKSEVFPVALDVTDEKQVQEAVRAGVERFGRVDVLVNNAGFGMSGAFEETTDEDLRRLMETDYYGVVRVTRAVLPHMRQQKAGKILNISSQGGLMAFTGSSAYCSAKFAVVGLSLVLRSELEPFGIQVAAVCPGSFRTDFRKPGSMQSPSGNLADYDGTGAHAAQKFLRENPSSQKGDPAKAAAFLYAMVQKPKLPGRILIGEDCCRQVKEDLQAQIQEIETYEKEALQTDY